MGSAHPRVVKEIRDAVPDDKHASVTLGVVPNQVGTVAMAVYTAGLTQCHLSKGRIHEHRVRGGGRDPPGGREALEGFETKLIGSLFADNPLYGGLDPHRMVALAAESRCDGFLVDTLTKDGPTSSDFSRKPS